MRLIQTNLREIDADIDPDEFVGMLKDFSADVVLFNAGGIVANYDTSLDFHYKNPYMKNDFMGEVIKRTKEAGIRFMARFDFSKLNESIADKHPEWKYVSMRGENVNYNGQVHVCLNSYYQQEYSLEILGEVIDKYPIDSVFFNMIGYQRRDYSGNYHGICQCQNCKLRFKEYSGMELPREENEDDPAFIKLEEFCLETKERQFDKISQFVKSKNPEIALCTYTSRGIDVWRKESNSGIGRDLPEWNYSAKENTNTVLATFEDKQVCNSAVHFSAIRFRHTAVAPDLTYLRIAENIANAAWLDYYIIGPLERQDDRACFEGVKELYRFYKDNTRHYTGVKPVANLCIIQSIRNNLYDSRKEFMGATRMLAESHTLFDILPDTFLEGEDALQRLSKYQAIILPDTRLLSPQLLTTFDAYVEQGGNIIATGLSGTYDQDGTYQNRSLLQSSGLASMGDVMEAENSAYFRIRESDKKRLGGFKDVDLLFNHSPFVVCQIPATGEAILGRVPPYMYGPPEKCYYKDETDIPGVVVNRYGSGSFITIPWGIGYLYQIYGQHGHFELFKRCLSHLAGTKPLVEIEASPTVEITSQIREDGAWQLVSLVNHSGQNGSAFHPPIPMRNIPLRIKLDRQVSSIRALRSNAEIAFEQNDDQVALVLPQLELFETLVLTF